MSAMSAMSAYAMESISKGRIDIPHSRSPTNTPPLRIGDIVIVSVKVSRRSLSSNPERSRKRARSCGSHGRPGQSTNMIKPMPAEPVVFVRGVKAGRLEGVRGRGWWSSAAKSGCACGERAIGSVYSERVVVEKHEGWTVVSGRCKMRDARCSKIGAGTIKDKAYWGFLSVEGKRWTESKHLRDLLVWVGTVWGLKPKAKRASSNGWLRVSDSFSYCAECRVRSTYLRYLIYPTLCTWCTCSVCRQVL